jgi:alanine racemase
MAFPSPHVRVEIDLRRIRQNVFEIRQRTGVPLIAVIKADAYGLGADRIAPAVADLVDAFCVFRPEEAKAIDLWGRTKREAIAIGPPTWADAKDYIAHHVRPAVSRPEQLAQFASADPLLCVDTGQQRFACDLQSVAGILPEGGCNEAFTHATTLEQVRGFREAVQGRVARMHAAGSSLLHEKAAWLDAVRPGLAIYQGAVRVSTRLVEIHKSNGPAGYTGFQVPWHGVILAGYSNGLRTGPCLVNGRPSRVLEAGMQSAFVEVDEDDDVSNAEVVLMGDGVTESQIATAWGTSPHEALLRLTGCGIRTYAPT